ncbi:hypothetical protein B0T22DRAFT_438908 [Podospora appendiculata]|uniref:Uncharacterized protein n=1 Tax=Podospora appendiculata TaxID=314037 RepID=A0AAE1CBB2_9PEZI|nr:hypothetical protein B0T22DRAFT_438908 [Podospora appendiculata]
MNVPCLVVGWLLFALQGKLSGFRQLTRSQQFRFRSEIPLRMFPLFNTHEAASGFLTYPWYSVSCKSGLCEAQSGQDGKTGTRALVKLVILVFCGGYRPVWGQAWNREYDAELELQEQDGYQNLANSMVWHIQFDLHSRHVAATISPVAQGCTHWVPWLELGLGTLADSIRQSGGLGCRPCKK